LRTIFLSEKIVPKMSFASSWALSRAGRARAGPRSGARVLPPDAVLEVEMGLVEVPDEEMGRSCRAQRRE
jgi:hypothetical protein